MRLVNAMLEIYPPPVLTLAGEVSHQFEFFSGFYALQAMMVQVARKQEYQLAMKERSEQGLPQIEGMETVNHRLYNLIGKDMVLQDAKDPLGAKSKSAAEQKE